MVGAAAVDCPGGPRGKYSTRGLVMRELVDAAALAAILALWRLEELLDSELGPDFRLVECRETVRLTVLCESEETDVDSLVAVKVRVK